MTAGLPIIPDDADRPQTDSDYVVQFKIKNGPLLRAMRMRGFTSGYALAKASGLPYGTICRYLALTLAPIAKTGGSKKASADGWNQSALKLAKFLRLPPDMLFPEQHLEKALAKNTGEFEMTADDVQQLIYDHDEDGADKLLMRDEVVGVLHNSLAGLTPREEQIIRWRYGLDGEGEKTVEEIVELDGVGKRYKVGRQRIHQIIQTALGKLSHPLRCRQLENAGLTESFGIVPRTHMPPWLADEQASEQAVEPDPVESDPVEPDPAAPESDPANVPRVFYQDGESKEYRP